MNLLISNDDGVSSLGIKALCQAAMARGHHAVVAAPSSQCSAMSQHLTLSKPILVHELAKEGKQEVYSVEGTPADCVRLAPLLTANNHFDFCITGVNKGENVSSGILYSGTVASAREAAMMNIPSIAVSLAAGGTAEGLHAIAAFAVRAAEHYASASFPRYGILNINGPKGLPSHWKKPMLCPVSESYFKDTYVKRFSPYGQMYFWIGSESAEDEILMEEHEPGTDAALLEAGHVTCTFLGGLQSRNELFSPTFDAFCSSMGIFS